MKRVLLSAYQCGPGMGSVSQIGWEWYARMSRRVPVTLITHSRNRQALERANAPLHGSEVIYIDTEWFAGPLYRFAKWLFPRSEHSVFLASSLDYFVWDRAAVRQLRTCRRRGEDWSVVHAVTPVSPVAAGTLHRLGLPVVLGPWNGGLASPATFPEIMRQDSAWLYRLRQLGAFVDRLHGTTSHAATILTATKATDSSLPGDCAPRTVRMLENGVDLDVFSPAGWPEPPSQSRPLEVVFTGRLVPFKGLPILFNAISSVAGEFPVRLTVVGDGPMRSEWERESSARGFNGNVRFTGSLPLKEVADVIRAGHVFCLPSVRESGGAVLLEAMACQRPVIAIAHGGPAEIVDDEVGIAVPPAGPAEAVRSIADALRDIVRNPKSWEQRGRRGRERAVERFGWDAKMEQALALYRRVAEKGHRV